MNQPLHQPSFSIGAILLSVLVGVSGAITVYFYAGSSLKDDLLDRARIAAAGISPEEVAALSGSEDDLNAASYLHLKDYLARVRAATSDTRFAYVMGENDRGELFVYVDSENPSSPDYSPPGQTYYEATPVLLAVFSDGVARVSGPVSDRWGTWISSYVPIIDDAGTQVGVLGLDVPASDHLLRLVIFILISPLTAGLHIAIFTLVRRKA